MTETKSPKVIILNNDDSVLQHAQNILSQAGWEVICSRTTAEAIDHLAKSQESPFALFISDSKLPKMEGDDILMGVRKMSPLTNRMLLVPSDDPEMLINAINKAKIHSCITTPINEKDLVQQAKNCLSHFKKEKKKEQLKRVTDHQNTQMFKIAQKLKKKNKAFKELITHKKAELLSLKSNKRKKESQQRLNTPISLDDYVEHKNIPLGPDELKGEYVLLCNTVKELFTPLAAEYKIEPDAFDFNLIFSQENPTNPDEQKNQGEQDSVDSVEGDIGEAGTEPEDSTPSKELEAGPTDQDQDQPTPDGTPSPPPELLESIIKLAYQGALKSDTDTGDIPDDDAVFLETDNTGPDAPDKHALEKYFEIIISDNQVTAHIKRLEVPTEKKQEHGLSEVLDLLMYKQISYGILDDEAIATWLQKSGVDQIVIAEGDEPVPGKDGKIDYHFEINYTNPGKINEDGTIDFRDRGSIPYVSIDELMAVKTPPDYGKPGMTVSGTPIPVDEVEDPVFVAGPGTKLSEDGLSINAAIDGQPHLDAMGTVTVNPEIVIPGDVDFETGNIDFKGNIIVKGQVKEGFTVKGINLFAQEIEGGIIKLTGDLNVSAGITAADITTQGNVSAKFINNSTIMGFGDLNINKEIIDSDICISGRCTNPTGHIISSTLTAKLGAETGKIGTAGSKEAKIKVGIDEHVRQLEARIKKDLEESVEKSNYLKDQVKALEAQDQELYIQISEKAHIQDRSQLEVKELKITLQELEDANDAAGAQQTKKEIKETIKEAKAAENDLNEIFDIQDKIAVESKNLKDQIKIMEEQNKNYVLKKRALKKFAEKDKPVPVVTVSKTAAQGTIVKGPHSSIILSEDRSRCKIQEVKSQEEGIGLYDMEIGEL